MPTVNDTVFKSTITVTVPYATDRFYLNRNRVEEGWFVFASDTNTLYVIKDVDNLDSALGYTNISAGGGSGEPVWGTIVGTVSSQGDLQSALDAKVTAIGGTLEDGTLAGTTTAETIDADTVTTDAIAIGTAPSVDDTYRGLTLTGRNFGTTVAQWEAVYIGASSTWLLADANGSGTYPARGLAVASGVNGGAATILTFGVARNDAWNWTPGGAIYLSATAGGLTQTAPSTTGDKVQAVGYAVTADIAFFDFNSAYVEVA